MRANKYGNFLTVVLIVLIVIILVGGGILIYNVTLKPKKEEDKKQEAFSELDKNVEEEKKEDKIEEVVENIIAPPNEPVNPGAVTQKKTYYEGFVMIGYITIPKTNVKEPILDVVTPEALDTAVAVLYPSNPKLNEPGNVVIIGHNYRNGKLFSDNEKLSIGDKVLIKDTTGRELTYTIYQKFQTSEQDTSFYTRDTNGVPEITLSTCTDDSKARIIILAKAD